MIPSYESKEIFFHELKENVKKIIEKDDTVLQKIEQMIIANKHFITNDDQKMIKKILMPLKDEIIHS